MATVTSPTPDQIVAWTGLNQLIEGTDQADFQDWLDTLVSDAEAEVAVTVGESVFDGSSWSSRKALLLTRAIAYVVAAAVLVSPELQRVTGTHAPLLVGTPAEIRDVHASLRGRAANLISLATQDAEASPTFALPVCDTGGISIVQGDRTPTQRNALEDERDDISDEDTDRG